jgi:transcriptional regulator with XRE-family HTH domain
VAKLNAHWTESSTADYLYTIGADYVRQIEQKIGDGEGTQAQLAARLGVTKGRVSQVLNHPGNITLRTIVEYARALGLKVAVIAYDDGDPHNFDGPLDSEIFTFCWEMMGKPKDFFDLKNIRATADNRSTRMMEPPTMPLRREPQTAYSDSASTETADNHPDRKVCIVNG